MQDDLAHPWSVRELASIAYLSPTRLRQLFVEAYEMPPISWLTRQRVRTMAKLLCESDISVREVKRPGFCSESQQGESEYAQEVQSRAA